MVELSGVDAEDHSLAFADLTAPDSFRSVPECGYDIPIADLADRIHEFNACHAKVVKICRDIKGTLVSLRTAQSEVSLPVF